MTTTDSKTGLPLVGAETIKSIPIDLKLLPELRELEEARNRSQEAARTVGFQLVLLTGTAAAVGAAAFRDDKLWMEMVYKIAAMNGIEKDQVKGTDLDKGVIELK